MASKKQLMNNLDAAVSKLNDVPHRTTQYDCEIGSHHSGVAIDVTKGGEPMDKAMAQFGEAALNAGYVVTGTYVSRDHTRFFLHEAEEFGLAQRDEARAEGFLAGVFVSAMAQMEDSEDDVETAEGAVSWIRDRFGEGSAHVSTQGPDEKNPFIVSSVDETPDGWSMEEDGLMGGYLVKEP